MPNRWVVNASPLILLAKVSHSGLLVVLSEHFGPFPALVRGMTVSVPEIGA